MLLRSGLPYKNDPKWKEFTYCFYHICNYNLSFSSEGYKRTVLFFSSAALWVFWSAVRSGPIFFCMNISILPFLLHVTSVEANEELAPHLDQLLCFLLPALCSTLDLLLCFLLLALSATVLSALSLGCYLCNMCFKVGHPCHILLWN